jgi:predicted nucleic acid-binding protein
VILLDTNVVSETMKRRVDPVVAAFIDQLQIGELFLPSLVAGRNTLPIASAGGRSSPR